MYVKGANFEGSCCGVVALNQVVYVFLEKKNTFNYRKLCL